MTDDEFAVRDLIATWMRASNNGDLPTILSLMADNVEFMVPGREPFGKEAFATMSRGMKGIQMNALCDIRELRVLGDWAYVRSVINVTITPPAGNPSSARAGPCPSCKSRRVITGCWCATPTWLPRLRTLPETTCETRPKVADFAAGDCIA